MRAQLLTTLFLAVTHFVQAAIVEFDLSPPGAGPGLGLHPDNGVIPGPGNGSGNEIGNGIFLDTATRLLTLNLAYGSAFGFTDLTGPAFAWLLHGPAPLSETAPALFNLQSLHTFAIDPSRGGSIVGTIALDAAQEEHLLSGRNYLNIYTPANLGGELRAQLVVVPEPHSITLLIAASGSLLLWRRLRIHRRKSTRLNLR